MIELNGVDKADTDMRLLLNKGGELSGVGSINKLVYSCFYFAKQLFLLTVISL